ncbi:DUF58 domain-containing protein [Actinotalea sp. AC32]|nr:DUF58 domain-containing protein [Actinotalea sp. AC32]
MRRRRLRVSPLGRGALVTAVVLAAAGWWWGWLEASVPGAALLAVLVAAVLLTAGRSAYAVDLDLSDQRVTVGQRAVGRLEVRNTSRRRMLPARLELPVGSVTATFPLPSLGPDAVHEELFAVPTTRRAVVPVGPVLSVRGDPLGLVSRRVRWTDPVELYVHPELVPLTGAAAGVLRDLEGQATRVVSDADLSFHALRDYVAGDDRRHIHWRSTARTGRLVVRQFEDTRRTHTVVALSTAADDHADDDELELAVAAAASIGVQALRDERDLTVLADERRLHTSTPSRLLDDVAGLEARTEGRRGVDLARWVAREVPDASVAVLVTGSVPDAAALRVSAAHVPAGVRTLVLRCRTDRPVEVATHGMLSVATVGRLADLPRVLRRVVAG